MALGYGHYSKRNKKLPGVYVNFGKASKQSAGGARSATNTPVGAVVSTSDYEKLLNRPRVHFI